MDALTLGSGAFGIVVGWLTYRILARKEKADWSDLSTVIATVGGAAVLSLFPAQTNLFGAYAIGLFIGFFGYFVIFIAMARAGNMPWIDILTGKEGGVFIMAEEEGGPSG